MWMGCVIPQIRKFRGQKGPKSSSVLFAYKQLSIISYKPKMLELHRRMFGKTKVWLFCLFRDSDKCSGISLSSTIKKSARNMRLFLWAKQTQIFLNYFSIEEERIQITGDASRLWQDKKVFTYHSQFNVCKRHLDCISYHMSPSPKFPWKIPLWSVITERKIWVTNLRSKNHIPNLIVSCPQAKKYTMCLGLANRKYCIDHKECNWQTFERNSHILQFY